MRLNEKDVQSPHRDANRSPEPSLSFLERLLFGMWLVPVLISLIGIALVLFIYESLYHCN